MSKISALPIPTGPRDLDPIENSTNRCFIEGFVKMSDGDPAGRRGVWYREVQLEAGTWGGPDGIPGPTSEVTIIAGREGDDDEVSIRVGDTVDWDTMRRLVGCLQWGSHVLELKADMEAYRMNGKCEMPADDLRCAEDVRCSERCERPIQIANDERDW